MNLNQKWIWPAVGIVILAGLLVYFQFNRPTSKGPTKADQIQQAETNAPKQVLMGDLVSVSVQQLEMRNGPHSYIINTDQDTKFVMQSNDNQQFQLKEVEVTDLKPGQFINVFTYGEPQGNVYNAYKIQIIGK
ncbi:hypothetical protein A3D09_02895 [Candidatus Collierbacteria bacterium RIFCSPHIGHO2_02_FULL_49_10]|uniref:DUF5666 domain-containing protein n=1 Tax=Candidatus Collierbacteria bacterium RIFCSPHIGHO2_02_FULL_49_10 TaxID=1817723 RepID=A0A1F5EXV0_9BACT|nr:MAG: hypothetical protein A3D09_02895 [Candidatus Collierbacteria bacterium RIFCSPHIGHO2_02_FULL_49_10]